MKTKHYEKVTITVLALMFILFAFSPLEASDKGAMIAPEENMLTGSSYSAMGSISTEQGKGELLNKVSSLQIPFIENRGQLEGDRVMYYAKTFGGTVFVTKDAELVYSLPFLSGQRSAVNKPKAV